MGEKVWRFSLNLGEAGRLAEGGQEFFSIHIKFEKSIRLPN